MGIEAALLAAGLSATAASVAAFAINTVISTVVSSVLNSFTSKPKEPDPGANAFQQASTARNLNTRQPISPWGIIYGEVRKGGVITFEESTSNNKYYHRVVTLACHPCDSVIAFYLNDDVIYPEDLSPAGRVETGRYGGYVHIFMDLGTTGSQPFPTLVSASKGKWTDAHRQDGHTKVYVRYTFNQKVFATGVPKITVRLRGKKYTDTRTDTKVFGTNPSQIINDYLKTANVDGGVGVAAARINSTVLNTSSNIDDELVAVATGQSHAVSSVSADNNTLDLDDELCKFITGDVGQFTTAGTLPAGLALSTDYYLDVIRERSSNTANIRIKVATTLANLRTGTYIDITDSGAGTHTISKTKELRYTANGVISTEQAPFEILDQLRSAFAGRIIPVGGKWLIKSGAYEAPSVGFDESDMVGPISVQTKISRSDRFNAVKGIFVSPLQFDQPSEYPLVSDSTYQANDGGDQIVMDLDLPFTNQFAMAQRLGTIELQRHRREETAEVPVNMRGFLVTGGDVVNLSNTVLGFVDQPFEVAEWRFESEVDDGVPTYRINLGLRKTDAAVFSYSTTGEITQPPRSLTALADPFEVQPVTGLTLESGTNALFMKSDGSLITRIKVSWTASVDGTLSGSLVEFKKSSEIVWQTLGTVPEDKTEAFIFEVEDGASYDVQVTAIGYFGGSATPASVTNHIVIGKTEAPSTPTNFAITVAADGTREFSWDLVSDADVRSGGGYEIRYFLGAASDYSAMTALHDGILVASPLESNQLAAGTYTFAIKAVDSSGNVSDSAAFIASAGIGDPRLSNVLVSQNERSAVWPGTLVSCFIDNGGLFATGSQTWADLPSTWGALPSTWASIVTPNTPIEYTTDEIDITGIALDVKFRPLVSVTSVGAATITMQTGTDADGAATGSFVPLATITARYVKIKVSIAGAAPALSQMVTLIDSPAKTEDFDDIDTSDATSGLFERIATGHFKIGTKGGLSVITQAQITALQNVGAGFTWELINKSTTLTAGGELAAEFKIYNSSGTLADATVDILLRGVRST